MRSHSLADLTWPEVADYLGSQRTILVPVGSTEQHGPAGPLGVDTFVAIGLCDDAAKRTGTLVAPPIWTGDSFHHGRFPGTIWVRSSTLIALITDVATSLARNGFARQIYVNGHKGSNLPALTLALRELHESTFPEALFAIVDPLEIGREAGGELKREPEHHAGALEISQVMYRFPGKVLEDRLTAEHTDLVALGGGYLRTDLFGKGGVVDIPWSSAEELAFAPTGSIGSSASASVDLGREFHERMVTRLVEFVEWFERYDGPLGAAPA